MSLIRYDFVKEDGRSYRQYHRVGPAPQMLKQGLLRPSDWQAPSLRYHAMRGEFVAVSKSRMNRPFLPPKAYCPLCPTQEFLADAEGKLCPTDVPQMDRVYEYAVFDNLYPSLSKVEQTGHCEVVLYSPEHEHALEFSTLEHLEGLVQVWQDRSKALGSDPDLKHVFIFENRGPEVGVTLHHPHGQIYAFNETPPFIRQELVMAEAHFQKEGRCLTCDLARGEAEDQSRVLARSGNLLAYVPFAARYPYEVHITTLSHRPLIEDLDPQETRDLAFVLSEVLRSYYGIRSKPMPYLLVHHQPPHQSDLKQAYHWHIEIYPPYRAPDKLKFLAGVESGVGLFVNDSLAEEKAQELRQARKAFGATNV